MDNTKKNSMYIIFMGIAVAVIFVNSLFRIGSGLYSYFRPYQMIGAPTGIDRIYYFLVSTMPALFSIPLALGGVMLIYFALQMRKQMEISEKAIKTHKIIFIITGIIGIFNIIQYMYNGIMTTITTIGITGFKSIFVPIMLGVILSLLYLLTVFGNMLFAFVNIRMDKYVKFRKWIIVVSSVGAVGAFIFSTVNFIYFAMTFLRTRNDNGVYGIFSPIRASLMNYIQNIFGFAAPLVVILVGTMILGNYISKSNKEVI